VICEGAGSPAEINLRAGDVVNMGLARAAGLPVVVVGDIDRGGVFAALFGTLALLSPEDQALVAGFVINKFRGDVGLLRPGLDMLAAVTGRPTYGVLPWRSDLWADAEDSLAHGELLGRPAPPHGAEWLRVVAIRWPRIATVTDLEALAVEPGVQVRLTAAPADIAAADLVILPASTATVADLAWLRATGLADAVWRHAAAGKPLLGLASGYQMLGRAIRSASRPSDTIPGLGLLDIDVTLAARATVTRAAGTAYDGIPVSGYAIHHGHVTRGGPVPPLLRDADGRPEGAAAGHIVGTHWHGLFECDAFRRRFLVEVAQRAGRHGFRPAPDTRFAAVRQRVLDLLGDLVEEHLDTAALWRLIEDGPPPGLPFVPPGAPRDMTAPGP
ncbi:MAG: cobyric acid synthase, partial [Actinobacteria bacterium]